MLSFAVIQEAWGLQAKKEAVINFIADKMAYHGINSSGDSQIRISFYMDLIYKTHIEISSYGGYTGPSPSYVPLMEAWRSGRITTKTQDYVLAVFPDVEGYCVPLGAQNLSFSDLLMNAYEQVKEYSQGHDSCLLLKIPLSIITAVASDSNKP